MGEIEVYTNHEEEEHDCEKSKADDDVYDFSIYEEGETKYSDHFGPKPGHLGCFGLILMYFVNKKQEQIRKNQKSLISRNRGFGKGLKKSVRFVMNTKIYLIRKYSWCVSGGCRRGPCPCCPWPAPTGGRAA